MMPGSEKRRDSICSQTLADLDPQQIDDVDVLEGLRTFMIDDSDEYHPSSQSSTPPKYTPAVVVTPAAGEVLIPSQVPQSSSDETSKGPTPRRRILRKAATAPPGALYMYSEKKPQVPRRAMSAKTTRPNWTVGSHRKQTSKIGPLAPRISRSRPLTSKVYFGRRDTHRKSVGKLGVKPKKGVRRVPPHRPKETGSILVVLNDRPQSFSSKVRVKEALKLRNLEALKTPIEAFQAIDALRSPSSVLDTPRELYGKISRDEYGRPADSTQAPDARKTATNSLLPPAEQTHRHVTFKHESPTIKVGRRSGRLYIPGPICLEEKSAGASRRGSIATMEPFDHGIEPQAKRFSDMVTLDGIVMFFQGLGVVHESSEACLDRYWVQATRPLRQGANARKATPPVRPRPPMPSRPSSTNAALPLGRPLPSPETPGRRKPRLRQLLKSSRSIL